MADADVVLVYDKQCPACDNYCRWVRLRDAVGPPQLVDAREDTDILREITARGWDIDQGMVLKVGDQLYYGADAIHALALMGSRSGVFNRLNFWMFRSPRVASVLYPMLRALRNLLLKALRKSKINNLGKAHNERF